MTASRRGVVLCVCLAVGGLGCGSDESSRSVTTGSASTTSAESILTTPAPTTPPAVRTQPSTAPVSHAATTTEGVGDCLSSLPFAATYLPEGWSHELRPGNGGEISVDSEGTIHPFDPPSPYFVHYSGHEVQLGSYINFAAGVAEPAASYEPLTVMGGAAQFGEIEDGYLVTFLAADSPCGQYSMLAYGLSADDARHVAEGLVAAT